MPIATLAVASSMRLRACAAALLLASLVCATRAQAVTLGQADRFSDGTAGGWTSGNGTSNPGTGGAAGAGDGYLFIAVPGPLASNLGAFSSAPRYAGNWTAAGVTQVRLALKDVGNPDALEIHVCVGNGALGNFWQCNTGLIPPASGWQSFTVDVTNAADFSFIGTGAADFAAALQNVDRILLRHDKAPYVKAPDTIIGDVGIDDVFLTNGVAGVGGPLPTAAGAPVRLAPAAPNPSRGAVAFRLDSPAGERVHVQVIDAAGRVVRRQDCSGAEGGITWTWDGTDERGVRLAPGYYRVRAWSRFGGMSQPIVRIE